jgi:ribose transport system substrate-binding protein
MSRLRAQGVSRRPGRRMLVVSLLAIGLVLGLAINASGKTSGHAPQAQQAATKTYNFVVSNNFVGNDWRPQVQRLAVLTSKLAPFKGKVNMKVVVAENTVQAHIQSLNNIIQTRPDAIMLIPSSDTAMNPSIKRACAAGIIVVTISAPVTEKCAWNANQDFYGGMKAVGRWMAQVLGRKGNVYVDRGIPGLGISKDIENGFLAGLKKDGPKIKVVGRFDGQYAPGPEQSGIANLLVGNPDVQGVMTQGYCTPVFNAFKAAGKGAVPATCYGYNGELTACSKNGRKCAVLSGSPVVMQIGMKLALDALEGRPTPPKNKWVPVPMTLFITKNPAVNLKGSGVNIEVMKAGKNFFPNLPAGLALPYTLPQYKITPKQAAGK